MWKVTNSFGEEKIWYSEEEYKLLQQENEDLKNYIQKMDKPEIKTIDSEIALKNIELQQENEKLINQTLKEIKKLSDKITNSEDLLLWEVYELIEKISDKINEVLNEQE